MLGEDGESEGGDSECGDSGDGVSEAGDSALPERLSAISRMSWMVRGVPSREPEEVSEVRDETFAAISSIS